MIKYKECPSCHTENDIQEYYCSNCDYDLSNVPVSFRNDNPASTESVASDTSNTLNAPVPVRKCIHCGQESLLTMIECPHCHNNLSSSPIIRKGSIPQPVSVSYESPVRWQIVSTDRLAHLEISEGQHIQIGWAAELSSYFRSSQKDYVSNKHGILSVLNEGLYFEDDSRNGTMVNGRSIPKGQAHRLNEGDILCLGGKPSPQEESAAAYFRIERR